MVEQQPLALPCEQFREPPAPLGRHVALRRRGLEQFDHLARGPIDVLLDEREEEVALAREVPVHGSLRVAGALGHLVDRGIAEAALGEDVGRRAKQLLPRVAALRACDAAAPVDARPGARSGGCPRCHVLVVLYRTD